MSNKIEVYWINNSNESPSNITFRTKGELLEYIESNILGVLKIGESEKYVIGISEMTPKKFDKLPDIDY